MNNFDKIINNVLGEKRNKNRKKYCKLCGSLVEQGDWYGKYGCSECAYMNENE